MKETGVMPDFIVVDGGEGGTGAAPQEFSNSMGFPLAEGLAFVHNTLVGVGLRPYIKIGASGKMVTASAMAFSMALGADWCNSARAFMFAVGCIQSQRCHTNKCPVGVATQDPKLQRALDDEQLEAVGEGMFADLFFQGLGEGDRHPEEKKRQGGAEPPQKHQVHGVELLVAVRWMMQRRALLYTGTWRQSSRGEACLARI
jgi:hypothetical protein